MEQSDIKELLTEFEKIEKFAEQQEDLGKKLLRYINKERETLVQKVDQWRNLNIIDNTALDQFTQLSQSALEHAQLHMKVLLGEEKFINALQKAETITENNIEQIKLAEEHDAHLLHDTYSGITEIEGLMESQIHAAMQNAPEETKKTQEFQSIKEQVYQYRDFVKNIDALIKKSFALLRKKMGELQSQSQ